MRSIFAQASTGFRVVTSAALLALPSLTSAQDALPPAKDLLTKYAAASGADVFAKHESVRRKGKMEVASMGLSAELEINQAKPNKVATKINVPGMGEIVQTFDGARGWAINPMQGPRLIEGKELDQMRDEAEFNQSPVNSKSIASSETVEKTTIGGQPCYKVRLTWKSGRETFDCYHVESGLLVGRIAKQESPMGTAEVVTSLSDYKDFGGYKVATKMSQEAMGQSQTFTILSVEFDVVDKAAFDPPAAIATLLAKKP